jgi:cellulose synthase/poly-beta-1,6-N-acetylglucosamine synthase-like glycosyltransferase
MLIAATLLLMTGYCVLMLVYKYGWQRQMKTTVPVGRPILQQRVSILIPARNERTHIEACLKALLHNDYPEDQLEIIVIDDFSDDDTAVLAAKTLGSRGRVLRLQDYISEDERLNAYKKKALEIAIAEASGDWIITTDADCIAGPCWIREMTDAMAQPGAAFVVAPVNFTPAGKKKDLVYIFQSLDFMTMQGITASSAALNLGNMCNGANLAFSRKAYAAVDGYKGIDHIASGDDMLLMHKIRRQFPDGIIYQPSARAIVQTPAQPDVRSFLNQRIRWSSKAGKYNDTRLTLILLLVYLFNLSLLVLFTAALFIPAYWIWLSGILFVKVLIELWYLAPVARFYNKSGELWYFPLLQPMHIAYIVLAGFLGKFGKYQWKGRSVH